MEFDSEFWWEVLEEYVVEEITDLELSVTDKYLGHLQVLIIEEGDFKLNNPAVRALAKEKFQDFDKLQPLIGSKEVNEWKKSWGKFSQDKRESNFEAALYLATADGHIFLTSLLMSKDVFEDHNLL